VLIVLRISLQDVGRWRTVCNLPDLGGYSSERINDSVYIRNYDSFECLNNLFMRYLYILHEVMQKHM
jgi:hypothetical protein